MKRRAVIILGMTLFSLFFGAGNLILPPQLGAQAGSLWWLVCAGFCLSAVLIPMLGILAYARLQGTMYEFGRKVSPGFSLAFCYLIYAVAISLPAPRTASVTHEMAVAPYLEVPSLLTSFLYFGLVFVFVLNRSRLSSLIGKWLSPMILLVLILLIGTITLGSDAAPGTSLLDHPFAAGILEGYQTFDAIGAVVAGGVIFVSLRMEHPGLLRNQRFRAVSAAGVLAGGGLALLYAGLILSGAMARDPLGVGHSRTEFLGAMSEWALGEGGRFLLSLLIALACFTTAVGIVAGTADFVKSRFGDRVRAYRLTAFAGCLLGVLMGQLPVDLIITVALPALMLAYPLTIVLILMNALPERRTPPLVFRWVVAVVLVFSIPDVLESLGVEDAWGPLASWPLRTYNMAWFLPAVVTYAASLAVVRLRRPRGNSQGDL